MATAFDDTAEVLRGPVGWLLLAGAALLILPKVLSSVFGQNGSFNPENSATDSCGNPETSYKSVGGVLGWLGAATNNVLGGVPASIGCSISRIGCSYNPNSCSGGPSCSPVIGCATASTDPVSGAVFEDRFRKPSKRALGSIPTSNQFTEKSGAIQSWSARPFQQGNNAAYKEAYDSSPPDPAYTMKIVNSQG